MIRTQKVPCNLCGSRDSTFLFNARDRLHRIVGTFSYVQCKQCGLVYMNPQVLPEETGKLYPADYAPHSAQKQGKAPGIRALPKCTMKKALAGGLPKALVNAKIPDSLCDKLNQQSRILDIGCGSGLFLNSIQKKTGCEVYGVDISENAVKEAKRCFGFDIFKGTLADAPFPKGYFDIITAWWYLEHIHDPNTTMAKITGLMKDSGRCIIGVPNFNSFNAGFFKDKWYHLDCPRHLSVWTPSTIRRLLSEHGLCVTKIVFDRTPWGLLGSLQYLVYKDNINPRYRNRLRQSLLLWILLLPWSIFISSLRKADIMVVYAKKSTTKHV